MIWCYNSGGFCVEFVFLWHMIDLKINHKNNQHVNDRIGFKYGKRNIKS